MALGYRLETLHLPFREPFRIARDPVQGPRDPVQSPGDLDAPGAVTVILALWDGADGIQGPVGLGEGFPDTYYGETPATIAALAPSLVGAIEPFVAGLKPNDPATARDALTAAGLAIEAVVGRNGAAKCAVDTAMHDLLARRMGISVVEMLGTPAAIPATDFTIGIDDPAVVGERAERAAAANRWAALKIKVGGPSDLETLRAVRRVWPGPLRVDANTAWQPDQALELLPELVALGVELVEQPFPARRLDQLAWLQERSSLPIVADESAVEIGDLDALAGRVAGVNVKLAKCGGIGAARRMLERAGELGFRRFVGCMEETSVGIAASVAVAGLSQWVDLDGCLLLADDPFEGLVLDGHARWHLAGPGLGVERRVAPRRPPRPSAKAAG